LLDSSISLSVIRLEEAPKKCWPNCKNYFWRFTRFVPEQSRCKKSPCTSHSTHRRRRGLRIKERIKIEKNGNYSTLTFLSGPCMLISFQTFSFLVVLSFFCIFVCPEKFSHINIPVVFNGRVCICS
jgi:hypothetical protein